MLGLRKNTLQLSKTYYKGVAVRNISVMLSLMNCYTFASNVVHALMFAVN